MTKKQTKEILTRETVAKALLSENKAGLRSCLILAIVMSVFLGLPVAGVTVASWNEFGPWWAKLLGPGLFGGIGFLMILAFWLGVFSHMIEKRLLRQGRFEVLVERVTYKSEEYKHRHFKEYLHFVKFKEVEVGHSLYQLTSSGDEFYVVIYQKRKPRPTLIYHTKMYEYREK